jgi:endoglucanase
MFRRCGAGVVTLMLGMAVQASGQADAKLAFERAQHLQHGINLSMWYAQTRDHSPQRLDNFVNTADFALIKRLGFDHVRLSIDPEWVINDAQGGTLKPDVIARIDRTVKQLNAAGLNVILDMHPEDDFKIKLATGEDGVARFEAFWQNFAQHYAATDPEKVFFEIMNEPTIDSFRWQGIQADTLARIRMVAPSHTIIATASNYSPIERLLELEPVSDKDVIYNFHDYNPMWFTHQGATWGSQAWVFLRGVPYPSTPENVQAVANQEPDPRMRLEVQRYGLDNWNAARMGAELDAATEWAKSRNVPLYCGEFGVYRAYAPEGARVQWISDMRKAMEARHIGWAMWDYQSSFGMVTKDSHGTRVDRDVVHALGLP